MKPQQYNHVVRTTIRELCVVLGYDQERELLSKATGIAVDRINSILDEKETALLVMELGGFAKALNIPTSALVNLFDMVAVKAVQFKEHSARSGFDYSRAAYAVVRMKVFREGLQSVIGWTNEDIDWK